MGEKNSARKKTEKFFTDTGSLPEYITVELILISLAYISNQITLI
jgi:hypothetical protein